MERLEFLIRQLKEQFEQKADPTQMMATVQQLQQELSALRPSPPKTLGTSKVAVVMPSGMGSIPAEYEKYAPKQWQPEPPAKEVKETVLVGNGSVAIVQDNGQLDMVFDPMTEIPTLSHQVQAGANEVLHNYSANQPESLNDKLKQQKTELVEVLKETPIKDLRRAIGINDRFLFIDDLFRGDEAMYERSIKTINSFNIYAEAEYWISRELKTKLGWDANSKTVQHFDQLVRRRFS
jgi:hypothetical protein